MMHTGFDIQNSSAEDMVFEFLEMSRHLLSLIEHENKILEECGCLSIEAYLQHRDALLKAYEQKATNLMTAIELSASPQGVNQLMVEEIASLKQALNDNTHYKFKNLEKVISCGSGDAAWH
ncbi:MAG: hypothetical protein KDJ26_02490 [Alphaproteobacteria bacterium]|jgi:hypothetical protein|nr:hypothetical protein [Alphaproteobacteria bacterium]MCB1550851.1 hypothetical protein [Alphaproteobacteria bacterium]MCB9984099.1 hypothetical protein [Micavibrio sp.]HRK96948.1 hypothetical protein [Alphaproteobacteria bacterium]